MNKLFPIVLALLFFGCDEDNPVASDTTPPIVTITFPVDGSSLSAQQLYQLVLLMLVI